MSKSHCGICSQIKDAILREKYCTKQHGICKSCWEGYYISKHKDEKPCLNCLNICNRFISDCISCKNRNKQCIIFCPDHYYCNCIQNCTNSIIAKCSKCECLQKSFCLNCFQFKPNVSLIHNNHYLCEDCKDILPKFLKTECKKRNTKSHDQEIQNFTNEAITLKNEIGYKKKILKRLSFREEESKTCMICYAHPQDPKLEWVCLPHYHRVCKKCSRYNFIFNKEKLPCLNCLELYCIYESKNNCNFCHSGISKFQLCSSHFYCECLKLKLNELNCSRCLELIQFLCWNCNKIRKTKRIHDNHSLCNLCEKYIYNSKFQTCIKCSEGIALSLKCSLCQSSNEKLQTWKCEKNNSVCFSCSDGNFIPKNEDFCLECMNAYYTNLEREMCCTCYISTSSLARFCIIHVFCSCIKKNPEKFKNHCCETCSSSIKFFCITCFKYQKQCQSIHKNHSLCLRCLEIYKNQVYRLECEECKNVINEINNHKSISQNKQEILIKGTQELAQVNLGHEGNFVQLPENNPQQIIDLNTINNLTPILVCKRHLINCLMNPECYHPECMQCFVEYISKKILKFYTKVREYDIHWFKRFHKYGCTFTGCKSSLFNYSIISRKEIFLEYLTTQTAISSDYLSELFYVFASYYEGFILDTNICVYCNRKNIIYQYGYCLYCSKQQLIEYIYPFIYQLVIQTKY